MKTDTIFYRLFSYLPSLIFDLVDLGVTDGNSYQFHSEEIKQTAFRVDGILTPPNNQIKKPLVFLEVQCQPDEDFYSRFFSEIFLYLRIQKSDNPWQGVVIYPDRNIERFNHRHHYEVLLTSSQVHIIYLDDLLTLETDNLGVQLLQLIQSKKQPERKAKQVIKQAQEKLTSPADLEKFLNCVETIMVYRLPTLSREEIRKMLNFTNADLKNTQFYKDVFAEGKETGELKGELKGELRGELKMIFRLCKKYYGELDTQTIEKMKQLSLEKMDELANLLIEQQDNFTVEKLTNWLFYTHKQ